MVRVVDPGQQSFDFSRQISEKCRFFRAISRQISIFPDKRLKNFEFFMQILEKFQFFHAIFRKISRQFSRQKLLIYSYFWANYSISLQKSPLSNILPVHDKI